MKLGIGAAQFGMDYGISNKQGKTPAAEVEAILDYASRNDIKIIDTAFLYGDSEVALGRCFKKEHDFSVVTKTVKFAKQDIKHSDADVLEAAFRDSLVKLNRPTVYGLLVHDANDLLKKNSAYLFDRMLKIKEEKRVKKIGISIYRQEQLDRILESFEIDMVQIPINIFDQRLLRNGYLKELKKRNIEIHARSIFLQGLLLMKLDELPQYFLPIKRRFLEYHELLKENRLTPLQACLGFVTGIREIDAIICGINSQSQLLEICNNNCVIDTFLFAGSVINDSRFIEPVNWRI